MRVLELFSGTHSVGKVCKEKGWEVVSLDLKNADINQDIMNWNYKEAYPEGYFDIVWASPPCNTFSKLKHTWIGRTNAKGVMVTMDTIGNDINNIGLPILRRTEEIIDYFKPTWYFIENPQTGAMKDYMKHHNHYDVDYCKYSDFGYKKRTRIWTNLKGFKPLLCKNDCGYFYPNCFIHLKNFGSKIVIDNGRYINVKTKELRIKYKNFENISKHAATLKDRYRIPFKLIRGLFDGV